MLAVLAVLLVLAVLALEAVPESQAKGTSLTPPCDPPQPGRRNDARCRPPVQAPAGQLR